MEKSLLLRKAIVVLLILLFILPLARIIGAVSFAGFRWDPSAGVAISNAAFQASLSTLVTLLCAFLGALGLLGLSRVSPKSLYSFLRWIFILPSFFPPLIVIVLGIQSLGFYPVGLLGVVFFHCLMNIGIMAIIFETSMWEKVMSWAQLSRVEGVSKIRFLWRGLLPGLKREFALGGLFLFVTYFLSFSIPFLMGGVRFGGLEVFIYEKIFLFGDWGEAIIYSLLLSFSFLGLSFFVPYKTQKQSSTSGFESGAALVGWLPGVFFVFVPLALLAFGFGKGFLEMGMGLVAEQTMLHTATLGLGTGLFVFTILSLISFVYLKPFQSRWLFALIPPSWVVVGFALFLLGPDGKGFSFFKCFLGLSILFVPYLYRLSLYGDLLKISDQVEVAKICGAPWRRTFFQVIWPQTLPSICFLSGIAAFWACGDFALTGMILIEESTLALQMKNYLMNYRLEQALSLTLPLFVVSGFIFCLFQGLSYVCRKTLLS